MTTKHPEVPFTVTIGSESWTYTTYCTACGEPIRWTAGRDETWVTAEGYEGCPDPLQPNEGLFPHSPADDSAQWEDQ